MASPLAWMDDALEAEDIELLPLTPAVAVASPSSGSSAVTRPIA